MLPIQAWPEASSRSLGVVPCDIDDTLTWDGRLPGVAYQALKNLREAGLLIVPITGRPGGFGFAEFADSVIKAGR